MNESEYKRLCETCDRILNNPDSNIQRIAIPWLHVLREHPMILEEYTDLFSPKDTNRNRIPSRKKIFQKRLFGFLHFVKSVISGCRSWVVSRDLPVGIDFLIISHILNAKQAGNIDDFYFGKLPVTIQERNMKGVIVLLNHSGIPSEQLISKWDDKAFPRVILNRKINLFDGISCYCSMLRESKKLRREAANTVDNFDKQVLLQSSEEALSNGTFANLRLALQIEQLVSATLPHNILVTHEGHAFERMVFAGARKSSPKINCLGYQHSGLFRMQHAIRRKLAAIYNPNCILTSGEVAKKQLENESGLDDIIIKVMGSNRSFDPIDSKLVQKSQNNCCLVLPEGFLSECNLLFEFSMKCAEKMPEVKFIWRLHPIVTFSEIIKNNPFFQNLPSNIILSDHDLDTDIANSQLVLYRGTTAVIKAISAGLKPLYLSVPGEMTIDPLYEISTGKSIVTSVDEFQESWSRINGKISEDLQTIQDYCMNYFVPFKPEILADPDIFN